MKGVPEHARRELTTTPLWSHFREETGVELENKGFDRYEWNIQYVNKCHCSSEYFQHIHTLVVQLSHTSKGFFVDFGRLYV